MTAPSDFTERPYHLAATYDPTSGISRIYIDGEVVATSAPAFGAVRTGAGTIKVGSDGVFYMRGKVSGVAVYTRALSQEEIRREMWCYPV